MIETFAALGEPSRFRIVELLRGGPESVGAIGERLELRQPQVSKHLRVLKEAGLVAVEVRAQQRVYALRPQQLRALGRWLERFRPLCDAQPSARPDPREQRSELGALMDELKRKSGARRSRGQAR